VQRVGSGHGAVRCYRSAVEFERPLVFHWQCIGRAGRNLT
jgi:hypothetical protein